MNEIIYFSICFFIVFFAFRKSFSFFEGYFSERFFQKNISARVDEILFKQMLIEGPSMSKKVSAFNQKEKERLEEMLSKRHGTWEEMEMKIRQSGIKMTVTQLISACLTGGIICVSAMIELEILDPILSVPIGLCVGSYLIYSLLAYQASLKKKAFLQQFPDAIDMMVRGVKAGLNLSRLIRLVSTEMKDPISSEFSTILQKLELGVPSAKVFADAAMEVDIEEFRFLSVAFILHVENGGMLVEILSNLSGIVRKRLELQLKIRAMSSESRMSAIVLCALPFVFALIMLVLNPSHLLVFIEPGLGQTLLKTGGCLFCLGLFSMFKLTKMEV